MKILLTLLLTAASVQATLIDLTTGGFVISNPPQAYLDFASDPNVFFVANASLNPPQPFGQASWDFTNRPGANAAYILVFGPIVFGGPNWENLYFVTPDERIKGSDLITINGVTNIIQANWFGVKSVPE